MSAGIRTRRAKPCLSGPDNATSPRLGTGAVWRSVDGTYSRAIFEALSRARVSWRLDMTRTSRLLVRIGIAAAAVMIPLVFATSAQAGPMRQDPWDLLAKCESSGNWSIDTGNGYYGGLQFSPGTWQSYGGGAYAATADHATRAQQIAIAEKVLRAQGWKAWPTCSRKLGLR